MRFYSFLLTCLILGACSGPATNVQNKQNDKEVYGESLDGEAQLKLIFKNDSNLTRSTSPDSLIFLANSQVKVCDAFVEKYPNHEQVIQVYLCKANAQRASGKYASAVQTYEDMENMFRSYENLGDVIFMRAFLLDEELHDKDRARDAYNKLITQFPNHQYADDARALLTQLHMDDQALLEHIKANKK